MKTSRIQKLITAFLATGVLTTGITLAIDVGDPVYKKDVDSWDNNRVEVLYEKYERDINIKFGEITASGPGGQVSGPGGEDQSNTLDQNLFVLRLNLLPTERVTFYLDAGVVDEKDQESTVTIVGGGARTLVYEQAKMRLNALATVHYVPSFDIKDIDASDPDLGPGKITGEADYYEIGAGMILSANLALGANRKIIPYGGILFSLLRGTVDYKYDYPDTAVTAKGSADPEEDSPVVLVAGASLLFHENLSLRIEGRIVGESSVSAAFGFAF